MSAIRLTIWFLLLAIILAAASCNPHPAASSRPAAADDGKIRPNDRLFVTIKSQSYTERPRARVDPDGKIEVSFVGQFNATGKTPAELSAWIGDPIRDFAGASAIFFEFDEHGSNISIKSGPFRIGDHVLMHVLIWKPWAR